jgi:hypothetical protein
LSHPQDCLSGGTITKSIQLEYNVYCGPSRFRYETVTASWSA